MKFSDVIQLLQKPSTKTDVAIKRELCYNLISSVFVRTKATAASEIIHLRGVRGP